MRLRVSTRCSGFYFSRKGVGHSFLHLLLQLAHLLAQALDVFLTHHLRTRLQIVYNALETVDQGFYFSALFCDSGKQLCVGFLGLDESGGHFDLLRLEKGHEMGQVNLGRRKGVRAT